jgi:hypothetical protein
MQQARRRQLVAARDLGQSRLRLCARVGAVGDFDIDSGAACDAGRRGVARAGAFSSAIMRSMPVRGAERRMHAGDFLFDFASRILLGAEIPGAGMGTRAGTSCAVTGFSARRFSSSFC